MKVTPSGQREVPFSSVTGVRPRGKVPVSTSSPPEETCRNGIMTPFPSVGETVDGSTIRLSPAKTGETDTPYTCLTQLLRISEQPIFYVT